MPTRILIADDHAVLRSGLHALLNGDPDVKIVGEAENSQATLRLAEALRPDLVLMDISMPDMGGIEATRRLKQILPEVQVLILTVHEDEGLMRAAIRAGASGYVLKRAEESEIVSAIQAVMRGDMYIHPSMTRLLLKDHSPRPQHARASVEQLTPREIDVLRYIARGYTNRQIAEALNLSPRTVEGHRANLVGKLGLRSRVELVNFAEEQGLLD